MIITVLLPVRPNGSKLPPCIIFKKANEDGTNIKKINGCFIFYNEKSWINQHHIKKWIDIVFLMVQQGNGKCLVWNSC